MDLFKPLKVKIKKKEIYDSETLSTYIKRLSSPFDPQSLMICFDSFLPLFITYTPQNKLSINITSIVLDKFNIIIDVIKNKTQLSIETLQNDEELSTFLTDHSDVLTDLVELKYELFMTFASQFILNILYSSPVKPHKKSIETLRSINRDLKVVSDFDNLFKDKSDIFVTRLQQSYLTKPETKSKTFFDNSFVLPIVVDFNTNFNSIVRGRSMNIDVQKQEERKIDLASRRFDLNLSKDEVNEIKKLYDIDQDSELTNMLTTNSILLKKTVFLNFSKYRDSENYPYHNYLPKPDTHPSFQLRCLECKFNDTKKLIRYCSVNLLRTNWETSVTGSSKNISNILEERYAPIGSPVDAVGYILYNGNQSTLKWKLNKSIIIYKNPFDLQKICEHFINLTLLKKTSIPMIVLFSKQHFSTDIEVSTYLEKLNGYIFRKVSKLSTLILRNIHNMDSTFILRSKMEKIVNRSIVINIETKNKTIFRDDVLKKEMAPLAAEPATAAKAVPATAAKATPATAVPHHFTKCYHNVMIKNGLIDELHYRFGDSICNNCGEEFQEYDLDYQFVPFASIDDNQFHNNELYTLYRHTIKYLTEHYHHLSKVISYLRVEIDDTRLATNVKKAMYLSIYFNQFVRHSQNHRINMLKCGLTVDDNLMDDMKSFDIRYKDQNIHLLNAIIVVGILPLINREFMSTTYDVALGKQFETLILKKMSITMNLYDTKLLINNYKSLGYILYSIATLLFANRDGHVVDTEQVYRTFTLSVYFLNKILSGTFNLDEFDYPNGFDRDGFANYVKNYKTLMMKNLVELYSDSLDQFIRKGTKSIEKKHVVREYETPTGLIDELPRLPMTVYKFGPHIVRAHIVTNSWSPFDWPLMFSPRQTHPIEPIRHELPKDLSHPLMFPSITYYELDHEIFKNISITDMIKVTKDEMKKLMSLYPALVGLAGAAVTKVETKGYILYITGRSTIGGSDRYFVFCYYDFHHKSYISCYTKFGKFLTLKPRFSYKDIICRIDRENLPNMMRFIYLKLFHLKYQRDQDVIDVELNAFKKNALISKLNLESIDWSQPIVINRLIKNNIGIIEPVLTYLIESVFYYYYKHLDLKDELFVKDLKERLYDDYYIDMRESEVEDDIIQNRYKLDGPHDDGLQDEGVAHNDGQPDNGQQDDGPHDNGQDGAHHDGGYDIADPDDAE